MYRAIIVDDEIWALRGMNNIIHWEDYGFEICKLCINVEEALSAIDEFNPDIVFTDIRMPFLSGMDLLNRINDSELEILTVIVSAYRDFDVAKQAIVKGVFAYLVKPLDKNEVTDVVERAKEKLDGNRIDDSKSIMGIDLSDETNLENPKIRQMFQQMTISANCYLILSSLFNDIESIVEGGKHQEIYISGYCSACLYCGDLPMRKSQGEKIQENRKLIGISMKHSDFSELNSMIKEAKASMEGGFTYSENKTVASIQLFLSEEYSSKINLKVIAEKFYLSEPYLYELFKKNTGTTVMTFIKNIRLYHAMYLLKNTDDSIRDIADKVGYEDSGYFGRLFRKELSCSPEVFRKKN